MRLILVVATGRTRRRMGAAVPVLVALATTLSGCGVSPENTSAVAVDCAQQVRFHGVVYTGYSYGGRPAARLGRADLAECDDMGLDAAGSVFPDDPEQVTVWSVRGYGADEVVAVRWRQDRVEAFLADALGARDRERVFRRLRRETP